VRQLRGRSVDRLCRTVVLAVTLLLSCGVLTGLSRQAAVPSDADPFVVNGAVDVAGRQTRYSYYFDHNALADALRVGNSLIALTMSGNLLRIDTGTMTLTSQAVVPGRATAIGKDDRDVVLLGTEDGEIASVDPATLARTTLTRVQGRVRWLSRTERRLIAVVGSDQPFAWPGEEVKTFERRTGGHPRWAVIVLENGRGVRRTLPKEVEPNSALVDGVTLWLANDRGEWGGDVYAMDLDTGRLTRKRVGNVRGLLRTGDGRLLAYGGLAHGPLTSGFIARVDLARPQLISRFEGTTSDEVTASHPQSLIEWLGEDPVGGGFWVLSEHTVYHASNDFSQWSQGVGLGGHFIGGLQVSLGNLPAINRLMPDPHAAELLGVSAIDGVWRVTSGSLEHLQFAGQLGGDILDIWPTRVGTLFLPFTWRAPTSWRLTGNVWSMTSLCPSEMSESGSFPMTLDASGLLSYCTEGTRPGSSAIVRLDENGHPATVESWERDHSSSPDRLLFGPRGQLFGFEHYGDEEVLWQRVDGKWLVVGKAPPKTSISQMPGLDVRPLIPLSSIESDASVVWVPEDASLMRLSRQPDEKWELTRISHPQLTGVIDAVAETGDGILLVSSSGLFRYHVASNRVDPLPAPVTDHVVTLSRDNMGRLWAAGNRLHVSTDEAKTWHVVDLPMLSPTRLKRVRPNPDVPGGIFLSLYDRGVLVLE
jgi:hypothetical protein